MANWYVCVRGGEAVGPVRTDLLVRGIRSGKVPHDAMVCRVGEKTWLRLVTVPELGEALPGASEFRSGEAGERYVLRDKLGEGGMGEVHRCTDTWIARDVAMKIMGDQMPAGEASAARFIREARIQGQLEHPSIVPIYDVGTQADGSVFFTMKRVNGETLAAVIDRLARDDVKAKEAYSRHRLLTAFGQVCLAVAFAHSRGIVHRDLKPANVMLGEFGEVSVLDWGLARVLEDSWVGTEATRVQAPPGHTQDGAFMGTPGYAAPEQVRGALAEVGPRSDVYSLGAILFELLAFEPWHRGGNVEAILASTLRSDGARPSERAPHRHIPPELDDICARATARDRRQRFATARELNAAVSRYLEGERDAERRHELARAHLRSAEQAFARASEGEGGETARVEAMRELGAALALEPTNEDAARTLVDALLRAPAELPPEAERALAKIALRDRVRGARRGVLFYVATLLPAPLLPWLTITNTPVGVAIVVVLFSLMGYLAWMWRTDNASPEYMRFALPLAFLLVGLQSTLLGPWVIVPGAAAATAAIFVVSNRANLTTRLAILGMSLASVVIPGLLQAFGVVPSSYSVVDGHVVIAPDLLYFTDRDAVPFLAFTGVLTVAATVIGVGRAVEALVAAERANFARAWRLHQILPGAGDALLEPSSPGP